MQISVETGKRRKMMLRAAMNTDVVIGPRPTHGEISRRKAAAAEGRADVQQTDAKSMTFAAFRARTIIA